jgi:hypothetical protein
MVQELESPDNEFENSSCWQAPSNSQDAIDHFNSERLSDVSRNSQIIQSIFYCRWMIFRHHEYTRSRIIEFCVIWKLKVVHGWYVKRSQQNID